MILDLVILGIVLILVIIGFTRGIARTLLNLLSLAAAALFSYLGAGLLANLIYSSVISPSVTNSVTDSMADSTASASTVIHEAIDGLPEFVVNFLNMLGIKTESLSESATSAVSNSNTEVAQAVDTALKPVMVSILSVVFIIILFILFLIIFKLIARKAEGLFELPIVGFLNRLLGGVLGLLEAVIICFVGIMVCKIIFVFSQDPFIPAEMISQSVIFSAVYYSDILNTVAGFIGFGNDVVNSAGQAVATGASEVQS